MTIRVTGTLTDPSGQLARSVPIRIITLQGTGDVAIGAQTIPVTNDQGVYDFQLENGIHSVEIRFTQVWSNQGKVTVTDDAPNPSTLPALLAFAEPLLPEEIVQVQQLVAEATTQATRSETEADRAEQEATRAQTIADALANAMVEKGNYDASSGVFPPTPTDVAWYNVSVAGTLSNADVSQPNLQLAVDDMVYYSLVQSRWYKINNQGGSGTGDMLSATYDPQNIADDAFDRGNHTGTQAISTIAGLQAALDDKEDDLGNPSTDGFVLSSTAAGVRSWIAMQGGGGTGDMLISVYDPQGIGEDVFSRTNHTGTQAISTITGLQAALDGKANVSHTHSISDITGLQNALDAKFSEANLPTVAQVTGLQAALDDKEDDLGNPSTDGFVLSSTTAGVRSWVSLPTSEPNRYIQVNSGNDIAANQRYVISIATALGDGYNGDNLQVEAQLNIAGAWGDPHWYTDFFNSASRSVGVKASVVGDDIIVQTGNVGILAFPVSLSGSGLQPVSGPVSAPCRVKVLNVE